MADFIKPVQYLSLYASAWCSFQQVFWNLCCWANHGGYPWCFPWSQLGWVTWRAGSIMQTPLSSSTQFELCSFPSFVTCLTKTSQHASACSAIVITGKERSNMWDILHHCCQGWSQLYLILNLYLQDLFWTLVSCHFSVFCHCLNQADLPTHCHFHETVNLKSKKSLY